jgi:hypothetical protein
VQNLNLVSDQLKHVFVIGDNHCQQVVPLCFLSKGSDDVIGFVAFNLQDGHVQGFTKPSDVGKLGCQIIRHLRPMGLIGLEGFMTKCGLAAVKYDSDIVRLILADQLAEHRSKTKHGVGRQALTIRQIANGVKRSEYVGHSVHQEDPFDGFGARGSLTCGH